MTEKFNLPTKIIKTNGPYFSIYYMLKFINFTRNKYKFKNSNNNINKIKLKGLFLNFTETLHIFLNSFFIYSPNQNYMN